MYRYLFTLGLCFASLSAEQNMTYYVPKTEHKELLAKMTPPAKYTESIRENKVLIPELKGIVISGDSCIPPAYVMQSVKGVEFYRMKTSLGGRERLRKELDNFVIGKPLTEKGLKQIKARIAEYFKQRGEVLVHVYVPEQEIQDGVIVVNVIEACLGKLSITGNCWFSEDLYLGALCLKPNEPISAKKVEDDVTWLNRSPWRKVCVVYKAGERFGCTDVEVVVRDERPIRVYAGADNTGFKLTDYARLFVGFNWGNFLNLDQIIGYQYTASPDFEKFQGHTLHYTAPLPWRHLFLAYGGVGYIKGIHQNLPAAIQKGTSWQFSSRYVFPIPEVYNWSHDARIGFDWKRTNNDVIVGEDTLSNSFATIFQGMVAYEGKMDCLPYTCGGKIEAFFQGWHVGQGMNEQSYDSLRPGAKNMYLYTRFTADYSWTNPCNKWGMMVNCVLTGQVATGPLLPLEQLGLGGFNSVRGYVDRAVNVDDGVILNLEVRSPRWALIQDQRKANSCLGCDSFCALVFLDTAYGALLKTSPHQPSDYFLLGVGPGLRYDFGTWLRSRFDMAFPLVNREPWGSPHTGAVQFYFSVILSY